MPKHVYEDPTTGETFELDKPINEARHDVGVALGQDGPAKAVKDFKPPAWYGRPGGPVTGDRWQKLHLSRIEADPVAPPSAGDAFKAFAALSDGERAKFAAMFAQPAPAPAASPAPAAK